VAMSSLRRFELVPRAIRQALGWLVRRGFLVGSAFAPSLSTHITHAPWRPLLAIAIVIVPPTSVTLLDISSARRFAGRSRWSTWLRRLGYRCCRGRCRCVAHVLASRGAAGGDAVEHRRAGVQGSKIVKHSTAPTPVLRLRRNCRRSCTTRTFQVCSRVWSQRMCLRRFCTHAAAKHLAPADKRRREGAGHWMYGRPSRHAFFVQSHMR